MTAFLAPQPRHQYVDTNGNPYSGAKLFTYLNRTTTKTTVHTDSAQSVPHSNPILLDSAGRPPAEIWLMSGITYTFVLAPSTDTDPPVSPILTDNDIVGINDTAITTTDQWKSGPTPTYISASSFSVAGNQTLILSAGRRVKITLAGTTVYATILTSVFTTLTTITLLVDNGGVIDNTISSVEYGVLTPTDTSIPQLLIHSQIPGLVNGYIDWQLTANTLIGRVRPNNDPTGNPTAGNPVYVRFRNSTLGNGTYVTRSITASLSITASSGSTLGTVSAIASRIYCVGIDTGSGVVLGLYNPVDQNGLVDLKGIDDALIYSSTAEGGAGGADLAQVIYTSSAQTSKPVAILGWFESSQNTAGTWAQAAIAFHTMGLYSKKTGDLVRHNLFSQGGVSTIAAAVPGGTIPEDDTIPQNNEGASVISINMALSAKANIVRVSSQCFISNSAASGVQMAMFKSGDANALVATGRVNQAAGDRDTLRLEWQAVHNLTSITVDIRLGTSTGTLTFNGVAGVRYWGGKANSYLKIEEIFV